MIQIYPQAEPFFLKGNNNTAILFIHGFTASPSEVYQVAQILQEESGATVSGVLLPGHGSHPRFLNRTSWQDWYNTVADETEYLLNNYEEVYVAGLSLGSLLAIYAGINFPDIKGIVAINPPLKLRFRFAEILPPILQIIMPYFSKPKGEQLALRRLGRFAYDVIPMRALHSMVKFRDILVRELPNLAIPLLLIQSLDDETVNPKGIYIAKDKVKSPTKLILLEDKPHVVTIGNNAPLVAGHIMDFMGN